jgi:hypothetical protein
MAGGTSTKTMGMPSGPAPVQVGRAQQDTATEYLHLRSSQLSLGDTPGPPYLRGFGFKLRSGRGGADQGDLGVAMAVGSVRRPAGTLGLGLNRVGRHR